MILVLNNRDLNQVTWEMRIESGDPKFNASQNLPDFPYAKYAEMLGFVGIRVDRREDVGVAWERAFSADRPALVAAWVDPNISIIPPHITFEQAKNLTSAFVKGDRTSWASSWIRRKAFWPVCFRDIKATPPGRLELTRRRPLRRTTLAAWDDCGCFSPNSSWGTCAA